MAGYIMTMNDEEALRRCITEGIYSTNLSEPINGRWQLHHEGTFGDFISMKPGDNIYFFMKRNVYGVGELIPIGDLDCKLLNYPEADVPVQKNYDEYQSVMLFNEAPENLNNRCLCFFKPSPTLFGSGVDMDDVLSSDPERFRMLRVLWKVSFIKIDDEENKALKDILLKRNERYIVTNQEEYSLTSTQRRVLNIANKNYKLTAQILLRYSSVDSRVNHEMALEASIIELLSNDCSTIFGKWDYISQQVAASPFKPIDYMDKMDIFGYRLIPGYQTISKYLIIEIKKDAADIDSVSQTMKYVDFVNNEYAHGDYSMIEAFIVAYSFPDEVRALKSEFGIRNFTKGRRPAIMDTWSNLRLISYTYVQEEEKLTFSEN
jgi:hypothetical protein